MTLPTSRYREQSSETTPSVRSLGLNPTAPTPKVASTRDSLPVPAGAFSGFLVVFGFIAAHDIFISDIWFNTGPMLVAGGLCGASVVWSYREAEALHSTSAWFRYAGLYAFEMIALGAVSLVLLRPQFTMAELMVADDAFERLLTPSMPLLIGAMILGTVSIWVYYGRRPGALLPILLTQVLLVFLLGHQFAFLGLVESSSALLLVFVEFSVIVLGLTAVFCLGVIWLATVFHRLRSRSPGDTVH